MSVEEYAKKLANGTLKGKSKNYAKPSAVERHAAMPEIKATAETAIQHEMPSPARRGREHNTWRNETCEETPS